MSLSARLVCIFTALLFLSVRVTASDNATFVKVATLAASDSAHDVLKQPSGVAVLKETGTAVVADTLHHRIVTVSPSGAVTVLAGNGSPGYVNGNGAQAQFNQPSGVAVDEARRVIYVADTGNNVIRALTYDGTAITLAGSGRTDDVDGTGTAASLKQPAGVALDAGGNLYVADAGNSKIKIVTPAGTVTTFAGAGHDGLADGPALTAQFKQPQGVAVSATGALFVADTLNSVIRKIENGAVTTLAGTGHEGFVDGPGANAEFKEPSGVAVDDAGNVWVADTQNSAIRLVTPAGVVSTLCGGSKAGYLDGALSSALFNGPAGIATAGPLFIGDSGNDALRVIYAAVHVTSVYPTAGPVAGGNVIRLFGTGFVPGATQVTFGTIAAAGVTFVSPAELLVTVPSGSAGAVDIAVTTPAGRDVLSGGYTFVPPPTIATLTPAKGKTAGGETVTIIGSNFIGGPETTVTFGGAAASSITVVSGTTLTAVTPAGAAGPADLTVTTVGGSVKKPAAFTYFAPPVITSFAPSQGSGGATVTIQGQNFDPDASGDQIFFGNLAASVASATSTQFVVTVPAGATTGKITVTTAGGTAVSVTDFVVATITALKITSPATTIDVGQSVQFNAIAFMPTGGAVDVTSKAAWSSNNPSVSVTTTGVVSASSGGSADVTATLSGFTATLHVTANALALPPDPATIAPKLDQTIVGVPADEFTFLYSGPNAIQTGVAAGTIRDTRATVIRGMVRTLAGAPLPGVTVTALGHAEYGQTLTRADGVFDFAINGGGSITLQFGKNGFMTAQRPLRTTWNQQTTIDDVVLLGYDTQVSTVTLGASSTQVAQGSSVSDAAGTRRATLIVPTGTTAVLTFPNGTTQPLSTLNVRATEYSVGPNGPKAMPATLPPSSGYTYCVELSADEALVAGATGVRFSSNVVFYVENFVGFRVGGVVPVGYYDRQQGLWLGSKNGVVLKILSITNGLADLDTNGDGVADSAAILAGRGITDDERRTLAALYTPGQTLWRAALNHFSPWDHNWPYAPPPDATGPNQPKATVSSGPTSQDQCAYANNASAVNCFTQSLSESIPLAGTPFKLQYESSRSARTTYKMVVPVSGATLPQSLKSITLTIGIGGKAVRYEFPPQANLSQEFTWDGTDTYGRQIQGARSAYVAIGYNYKMVYSEPSQFEGAWDRPGYNTVDAARERTDVSLVQTYNVEMGHLDANKLGLGNWTLSAQHFYDGRASRIYESDGQERAGDPNKTSQVQLSTYAGNLHYGYNGDGGPATQASFDSAQFIAAGPDGALYIADCYRSGGWRARIRRVDPDSHIIDTIAGNGTTGYAPDGSPALGSPMQIGQLTVAPDGTIYFVDGPYVRKIVNGVLATVAGNGQWDQYGGYFLPPDGSIARQIPMNPYEVAVDNDGSIYVGTAGGVLKIGTDGLTTGVYYGKFPYGIAVSDGQLYVVDSYRAYHVDPTGRYGLLTNLGLAYPSQVAVAPDGTVLVSETGIAPRIRAVHTNGITSTLIGTGRFPQYQMPPDGLLALSANIGPWGVAAAPDGSVYIMDMQLSLVRKTSPIFPVPQHGTLPLGSEDGSTVDIFENGRHTRTVDALTGNDLLTLGYDGNGFLTSVTDQDSNVTRIERAADGTPSAVVAPGGQRTTLTLSNGQLTNISDEGGNSFQLTYNAAGLVEQMTDPRKGVHKYTYDGDGRLTRDEAPDGSYFTVIRSGTDRAFSVTRTTAEGRAHTYQGGVSESPEGSTATRENDSADGSTLKLQFSAATTTATASDGVVTTTTHSPDPRFGMQSSFDGQGSITAGGLTMSLGRSRTVTPDAVNPFAIASLTETFVLNGRTWTSTYDRSTRSARLTSPLGRTSTSLLDEKGRPLSVAVPGITASTMSYNAAGQLASIQQGNRVINLGYDDRRRLTSVTDPLRRTVRFGYDTADRVIAETLPDGRVIGFTYDENGNVTSVTPPSRPAHLFTFTAADLVDSYTPPTVASSGVTRYTYDLDRQLTSIARPDGSAVGLHYDAYGRLATISIARGTYAFSYLTNSRLVSSIAAPDGGANLSYGYNGPLLSNATWSGAMSGSVSFTYDNSFRVASETAAGAATTFTYDADGLLATAGPLTLQRDAQNGLILGTTLSSVADAWTYDGFGAPAGYSVTASGSPLFAEQFTRNDVGQIVQKVETIGTESHTTAYAYDTAGRLSSAQLDAQPATTYRYDDNGNRLSRAGADGTAPASYDDQDRLLTYGSATYTYTANGELASKSDATGTTTYNFDELGNLLSVTPPNGNTVTYIIDGENRRVGRNGGATGSKRWLYAGTLRIVAELDENGALVSRFVYASRPNVPDFMVRAGVTYRMLSDNIGSVRLVLNASSGEIAQRMDYDEFGRILVDTNPGFQPFGFAGGLYDPDAQLIRFGARDYDPQTGRWTAKDPILFNSDVNLYRYAFADPVNWVDFDGLAPGDPYATRNAAASAAIADVCGMSREIEREFGGYVYRNPDGTFSYTPPLHGYKYDMRNLPPPSAYLPRNVKAVGIYHTHPDYSAPAPEEPEEFSYGDESNAHKFGIPNYVGTPSGRILRYNPYPNSSGGYTSQIGSCGCQLRKPSGPEFW